MIDFHSYITQKDYFCRYEELYFKSQKSGMIKIANEIFRLCRELKQLINQVNEKNFFEIYAKVSGIDSKLYLLNFYIEESKNDTLNYLDEKEYINLINEDYRSYFKELCGFQLGEKVPFSLFFSII